MSKLEVNTLAPQTGTTITIGESGDTVALGSGATQSGFGGTNTPAFFATLNATQNAAGSTNVTVLFNQTSFDTNSGFNTSTGKYTIPTGQSGKYFFYWGLMLNNDFVNRWMAQLYKDGTAITQSESYSGAANYITTNGNWTVDATAGEVYHINHLHSGSATLGIYSDSNGYGSYFGGFKLIGV